MANQHLTDDQQAVMDVIVRETAAAYNRDFETWQNCWAHEPTIRRIGWLTPGGVTDVWGWDEFRRLMLQEIEEFPGRCYIAEQVTRENLVVHVSGDLAYATYDEYAPRPDDPVGQKPVCGRAARVLRRIDGQWRIIHQSCVAQWVEPTRAPMFRVNKLAAVSWMNKPAEQVIANKDHLEIVAGRLATKTLRETKMLRAAIRQASESNEKLNGRRLSIPILLEQGSDEHICVCWAVTEGTGEGSVLVSLNNLDFALDKIDAAAALFGMSPAQQRLAEHIASGHDVVASAALLGITASTARTHLQRIYDKTGVHNQAALVRTLLSIGGPE